MRIGRYWFVLVGTGQAPLQNISNLSNLSKAHNLPEKRDLNYLSGDIL